MLLNMDKKLVPGQDMDDISQFNGGILLKFCKESDVANK